MTTNGGKAMAPWGGAKNGSSPGLSQVISAPGGKYPPLMLDMANTGVARGKIYLAKNRHEKIPLGFGPLMQMVHMTEDPDAAINGLILPMAHHKGYAIATLMDVLAGVVSGSNFLSAVNGPYHYDKLSGCGHFITVYNIEDFIDLPEYLAGSKHSSKKSSRSRWLRVFRKFSSRVRWSIRQILDSARKASVFPPILGLNCKNSLKKPIRLSCLKPRYTSHPCLWRDLSR